MGFLYKNKNLISIIVIAMLVYARCALGLVFGNVYVLSNVAANLVGIIFCGILTLNNFEDTKKALLNVSMIWLLVFSALVFIYGHFKIGVYTDMYSRQYHILTVVPAVLIMLILFHNRSNVLNVVTSSSSIVIVATIITSIIYDPVWKEWLQGMTSRVGATPAGTCVDTGNLMLVLLIPILYQVIINKKYKQYLWAALLAVFQIVASGSKSSVLPIAIVFAILLIGSSKDKKTLRRNIIILVVLLIGGAAAIMLVPALYGIIGDRIVEMFSGIGSTEYDLHTSTGQRMAVIAAFKEHFWEKPIFGHGFYAFKEMPYSLLEEYRPNEGTEIAYRHIHTHMNFMELLFSFGIVGFVLYYWFPVLITVKAFFTKNKMAKLIVFSFMASFVFMDLGIDMFYVYMTPYYTYLVGYTLLKSGDTVKEDK